MESLLTKKMLENVNDDYFQGLLEIMEFWASMNKLENPLDIFPNNKKLLQCYFTQSSYESIVAKNEAWLNKEVSIIVKAESQITAIL